MRIMKAIALVLTFAGVLPAQQGKDARVELANVIAVEEQEHDFAKAATLYRAALHGTELSESARALANLRLGRVLQALGKDDEAKPFLDAAAKAGEVVAEGLGAVAQDPEREKALRAQARELVQKILKMADGSGVGHLTRTAYGQQLSWLGESAVPEVIATIDSGFGPNGVTGAGRDLLFSFLWQVGGEKANTCLVRLAHSVTYAGLAADQAGAMSTVDPESTAVRAYLEHTELDVRQRFVMSLHANHDNSADPLLVLLPTTLLIESAERGDSMQRASVLHWFVDTYGSRRLDDGELTRVLKLVRIGLEGTDPDFGQVAEKFLMGGESKRSVEGLSMLLDRLPRLDAQQFSGGMPSDFKPTPEMARVLWPKIDATIKAIGLRADRTAYDAAEQWLTDLICSLSPSLGSEVTDQLLEWTDLGYPLWPTLSGKITPENAARVFARYPLVDERSKLGFVSMFQNVELPRSLFPAMREQAAKLSATPPDVFTWPMVGTGNPEAAGWILARWKDLARDQGRDQNLVTALLALGRRTQAEPVHAAMRELAESTEGWSRSSLVLALLSMHDEAALTLATKFPDWPAVPNPYAPAGKWPEQLTPLQYLLYSNPNPPHGFTEQELVAFVATVAAKAQPPGSPESRFRLDPARVSDRLVMTFAEHTDGLWTDGSSTWQKIAARRIEAEAPNGPLHRWLLTTLSSDGPAWTVFTYLYADELARIRPQLDVMLHGEHAERAAQVITTLCDKGLPVDLAQWIHSKHAEVRRVAIDKSITNGTLGNADAIHLLADAGWRSEVAKYLGARLAVEAVPDLIALLKDPDATVRSEAADALTRIRFYHDQQAHWDRVLKGLDASPQTAVEKLLLQAKPDAPKPQRLLAITSLGTLGVPEALPFLIDWTNDADAEIADHARAAITAIHLNPRK